MGKRKPPVPTTRPEVLFDRIVTILEEARGNVVRAVNSGMLTAYWLIGREIVHELQGGTERAEYGRQVVDSLSKRLTERYGNGFSVTTLQYFRKFYMAYPDRFSSIPRPAGVESGVGQSSTPNPRPSGVEFEQDKAIFHPSGGELAPAGIRYPSGTKSGSGFLPELSWSHYRALMRVDDPAARDFYEREAAECGWSKVQLERQIHTEVARFRYEEAAPVRATHISLKLLPKGAQTFLSETKRTRVWTGPVNVSDDLERQGHGFPW